MADTASEDPFEVFTVTGPNIPVSVNWAINAKYDGVTWSQPHDLRPGGRDGIPTPAPDRGSPSTGAPASRDRRVAAGTLATGVTGRPTSPGRPPAPTPKAPSSPATTRGRQDLPGRLPRPGRPRSLAPLATVQPGGPPGYGALRELPTDFPWVAVLRAERHVDQTTRTPNSRRWPTCSRRHPTKEDSSIDNRPSTWPPDRPRSSPARRARRRSSPPPSHSWPAARDSPTRMVGGLLHPRQGRHPQGEVHRRAGLPEVELTKVGWVPFAPGPGTWPAGCRGAALQTPKGARAAQGEPSPTPTPEPTPTRVGAGTWQSQSRSWTAAPGPCRRAPLCWRGHCSWRGAVAGAAAVPPGRCGPAGGRGLALRPANGTRLGQLLADTSSPAGYAADPQTERAGWPRWPPRPRRRYTHPRPCRTATLTRRGHSPTASSPLRSARDPSPAVCAGGWCRSAAEVWRALWVDLACSHAQQPCHRSPPVPASKSEGSGGCNCPHRYQVLREAGTERAFTGEIHGHRTTGVYACRACGAELFGHGEVPLRVRLAVLLLPAGRRQHRRIGDRSLGMVRTEVRCASCGSHLGHVFAGEGCDTPTRPALLHQLGFPAPRADRVGAILPQLGGFTPGAPIAAHFWVRNCGQLPGIAHSADPTTGCGADPPPSSGAHSQGSRSTRSARSQRRPV